MKKSIISIAAAFAGLAGAASAATITYSTANGEVFYKGTNVGISGTPTGNQIASFSALPGFGAGSVGGTFGDSLPYDGETAGTADANAALVVDGTQFYGYASIDSTAQCVRHPTLGTCTHSVVSGSSFELVFSPDVDSVFYFDFLWEGGDGADGINASDYVSMQLEEYTPTGLFSRGLTGFTTNAPGFTSTSGQITDDYNLRAGWEYRLEIAISAEAFELVQTVLADAGLIQFAGGFDPVDAQALSAQLQANAVPLPAGAPLFLLAAGSAFGVLRRKPKAQKQDDAPTRIA